MTPELLCVYIISAGASLLAVFIVVVFVLGCLGAFEDDHDD